MPVDAFRFVSNTPISKRFIKYLKRHLILLAFGQKNRELSHIPPESRNILWINLSSPQLGDSLMDLSGRSLLKEKKLTLLTDSFTAQLYQNDPYFQHVTSSIESLANSHFDHILIDSYNYRAFKTKAEIGKQVPFSGMFGFFDGPRINKTLFSHHRINQLLNYPIKKDEINQIARLSLSINEEITNSISNLIPDQSFITVAVGGVWEHRTYQYWVQVINQLSPSHQFVLIGADNGKDLSSKITAACENHSITNLVSKLSILETAAVVAQSSLLICADGGLMHIAHSQKTPTVALFAQNPPEYFSTLSDHTSVIYDQQNVNQITPDTVADSVTDFMRSTSK